MSHGGNIKKLRELAGDIELIDFSASINPMGSPEWLRREIARNINETEHYPDIESQELIATTAKVFRVAEDQITPANGTTDIIFSLPKIFNQHKAVIAQPSYVDYSEACKKEELKIDSIALPSSENFKLDFNVLEKKLTKQSLVFLAHPNNPTGTLLDKKALTDIISIHQESIFIIDEAYLPFAPAPYNNDSFIDLIDTNPNLIVLRSLTKVYAMAGLRLGLAFAAKELTAVLRDSQTPWSVNTLSQKVGVRALQDINYATKTRKNIDELRYELLRRLGNFSNLHIYPTRSNFILCRIKSGFTADELFSKLIQQGIAIRCCSDFENLDNTYFRVAVRNNTENTRLITALAAIFNNNRPTKKTKKTTPSLMILGGSSNAGKSIIVSALCRILLQDGIAVAPFKSQNMALNSFVTQDGLEMGRAQAVQAQASRLEADIRMNPILLKPNSDTGSQVIVNGKPVGNMKVQDYIKYKETAFKYAKDAYDSLSSDYDAIILEGAGSPGEMNLKKHDIVNTRMAEYANASSILVGDIDRGGVYASFIGMYETFEEWERKQVKGFLVNRFRGDATLLSEAHEYVKDFTGREVLGVVPYLKELGLPEEDSVSFNDNFALRTGKDDNALDLALIALPHISNFTDFDALANEPDVNLRLVKNSHELGDPDCILLPGSKNVIGDLKFLTDSGLNKKIQKHAKTTIICGVCGGFQILGKSLSDPHNIEGGGSVPGLNLLQIETTLAPDKTLVRAEAVHKISNLTVHGYEIHHGETTLFDTPPLLRRNDGEIIGAGKEKLWGTYLHGIFDADEFRRYFINTIHLSRNHEVTTKIRYRYDLEPAFERLAKTVRESIELDKIYQMMGL